MKPADANVGQLDVVACLAPDADGLKKALLVGASFLVNPGQQDVARVAVDRLRPGPDRGGDGVGLGRGKERRLDAEPGE